MEEFKSFFKTVGGNEGNKCKYSTRLDTYGCGCQHDCSYCLDGDTNILMYDGSTKKIRDIEIGDEVYGISFDGKYYRYTKSIIENKWSVNKPSYKITLRNGIELICSKDHQWLTNRGWKYTTGSMRGENQRPYITTKNSLRGLSTLTFDNFEETEEYIKGYLCGVIRGDGNLTEYHYGKLENVALKNDRKKDLQIVSIEPYRDVQELWDITTSTRNFIANGVVSHNCYAKSLLDFRKLWNPESPKVADINKIENKIKKLPKDIIVRLGGMTDCFQPCELIYKVTRETIKLLNKYNIGYLIVTKSHIVANDDYMEILDKNLAHIQITVTTLDDTLSMQYEKASIPSKRIEAIKKLQDAGFDVAIRLSPLIPEYMDFDKLNSLGINKAIVEFLRVNSWIKKWFDIDYSKYSLRESNYNHLPLDEKISLISRVKIPIISVCEDVTEHYEYWKNNVNPNKEDCCNLQIIK